MSVPLVSVVLPVYNGEPYRSRARKRPASGSSMLEVVRLTTAQRTVRWISCNDIEKPTIASALSRRRTEVLLRP